MLLRALEQSLGQCSGPRGVGQASPIGVIEVIDRQNLTGGLSFVFLGLSALMVWIPDVWFVPHLWIFLIVGFITMTIAKHKMETRTRALRLGHPSFADHLGCEYETQGNNKILVHKFGYMTEDGEYIEQRRKFEGKLLPQFLEQQLASKPTAPILYLPEATETEREQSSNIVFIDEFKSIQVDHTGELEGSALWVGLFGVMAVLEVLMFVSFLARIIFIFLFQSCGAFAYIALGYRTGLLFHVFCFTGSF